MTPRTNIYFRNRRGHKKGLLILSGVMHPSAERMHQFRQDLDAFQKSDSKIFPIILPEGAKWEYIEIK